MYDFFLDDWRSTCRFSGSPSTPTMLTQVYGWAQFAGCPAALSDNRGYTNAITTYCTLQYNYLVNVDPTTLFNPYTQLIHKTLGSNAYAFSRDDKAAFKGVPEVKVGMQFRSEDQHGMQVVTVTKVEAESVTVDGNHPLAGVTLNFDVTVKDVRAATTEELAHGHVHGAGGHHH